MNDSEHVVTLDNGGWVCTCGARVPGLNADLFDADRLLRNASAEKHAHEYHGAVDFGAVRV